MTLCLVYNTTGEPVESRVAPWAPTRGQLMSRGLAAQGTAA